MISHPTVSERAAPGRQTHIEGLRAIAVLSVVLYHLGVPGFSGGFVGVDVFFVISGFLITRLIRNEIVSTGRFHFAHFYVRRVRRLFPALFFTLLVSTAVASVLFPPDRFRDYRSSLIAAALSGANIWFWSQSGYFDTSSIVKPLLHTWSLAVEEQFYLIWPLLLFGIVGSRARSAAVLGLAFCLSLGWNIDLVYGGAVTAQIVPAVVRNAFADYRSTIFYLLPFRVFELVIGAALVWVTAKPGKGLASVLTAAGLGLIAASIALYNERTVFPSVAALAPCLGAAALIYAGAASPLGRLFDNKPFVWIGTISYSVYLVHWPAIVFFLFWKNASQPSPLEQVGLLLFSLVAAALMYTFVEKPFRHPGRAAAEPPARRPARAAWRPGWRMVPLAATASAALITIGTSGYSFAGGEGRYRPGVQALLETDVPTIGLRGMPYSCFMGLDLTYKDIPAGCYEIPKGTTKKSIMFFGDSSAYHLMEGFQALLGDEYDIYGFVSASCAAVLGYSEPENSSNCMVNNDAFLHEIIDRNHYDLVIMSNIRRFDERIAGMPEVRRLLDEQHIPYVLLGQMPYFKEKPANVIARHGTLDGLDDAVRADLVDPCDDNEFGLDRIVPPEAFFSMKSLLCRRDGYPVYEIDGRLIHWDHVHFNQFGKLEISKKIVSWLSQHGYVHYRAVASRS